MTTDQVDFTEHELLASADYAEPLVVRGVRCHGGFDADGTYVSPRTVNRRPAIAAWQAKHRHDFGTDLLDLPLATWPEHYPNVAQTRYLIEAGVPEPIISALTRIGTVEGFGSMIRHSVVPAEELLADTDLVAGDGDAARLVSYISADETPHVDYLRTALSELRDRTIVGEGGRRHPGARLVGDMWRRAVALSVGANRQQVLETTWREVRHAVGDRPGAADLLARFDELGSARRLDDGTWVEDRPAA